MLDKVAPLRWDREAQENAYMEANRLALRDPEAASLLVTQSILEQEMRKEEGYISDTVLHSNYDIAELYDFACYEYGWLPRECDEMHYLTFFAMLNRANKRHQKESSAIRSR